MAERYSNVAVLKCFLPVSHRALALRVLAHSTDLWTDIPGRKFHCKNTVFDLYSTWVFACINTYMYALEIFNILFFNVSIHSTVNGRLCLSPWLQITMIAWACTFICAQIIPHTIFPLLTASAPIVCWMVWTVPESLGWRKRQDLLTECGQVERFWVTLKIWTQSQVLVHLVVPALKCSD